MMKSFQSDVEFVAEQAVPLGKVDAGAVVQALADAKPDAIFNVLFAADLTRFVREGNTRGLFENMPVVSVLSGEPEYLEPLGADAPTDGSSPATPGMPSTRPRTRTSSRPTASATTRRPRSARWWATPRSCPSPRA